MLESTRRCVDLMVPVAEPPTAVRTGAPPLTDVRGKRVGLRIESFPIEWTEDLLLRNFEIFMQRVTELLQVQCQPSGMVRFQPDPKDPARDPQMFDTFCRQIDWAILGIAG